MAVCRFWHAGHPGPVKTALRSSLLFESPGLSDGVTPPLLKRTSRTRATLLPQMARHGPPGIMTIPFRRRRKKRRAQFPLRQPGGLSFQSHSCACHVRQEVWLFHHGKGRPALPFRILRFRVNDIFILLDRYRGVVVSATPSRCHFSQRSPASCGDIVSYTRE
ncbi:MAG: hypothetical protein BWY93_01792 [Euryarchaeota archaeon ADurb.BinA087]|nr:MAG: hypothetical protein BWY93_01792 [Euryarchaeota archaeon ADurb.BinA087]